MFKVGRFGLDNNGERAEPVWVPIDKLVGQTSIGSSKLCCRVHPPAQPQGKAAAAQQQGASATGKRKAQSAPAADDPEAASDFLGALPEWIEGFDRPTAMPVHANARGGIKVRLPAEPTARDFHRLTCPDSVTPIEMIKSIAPDIESMSEPAVRKPSEGSCIDGTLIPMWLLWPVWQPDPMARAMSNDRRSTINDRASDGRSSDERAGGTLWGGRAGERAS